MLLCLNGGYLKNFLNRKEPFLECFKGCIDALNLSKIKNVRRVSNIKGHLVREPKHKLNAAVSNRVEATLS